MMTSDSVGRELKKVINPRSLLLGVDIIYFSSTGGMMFAADCWIVRELFIFKKKTSNNPDFCSPSAAQSG